MDKKELSDIEIFMRYVFDGAGPAPTLMFSFEPQEPGIPEGSPVVWDKQRGMWIEDKEGS